MTENFTYQHKLIEEIPSKSWFANPTGQVGYEIIVLKKVGEGGTSFYCTLKPGETLGLSERIFGKFTILAVDVRYDQSFSIEKRFVTRERGCEVAVKANVHYRVTNARVVAIETVDPLGKLRDKVIATLNRELADCREAEIDPHTIEKIIRDVGRVPHLGLKVEDAEVIEFTPNIHLVKEEKYYLLREHPELAEKVLTAFADRDRYLLQKRLEAIQPAIEAYIKQQEDIEGPIEAEVILHLLNSAATSPEPQIPNLIESRPSIWDGTVDVLLSSEEPSPTSTKVDEDEDRSHKKPRDDSSQIQSDD